MHELQPDIAHCSLHLKSLDLALVREDSKDETCFSVTAFICQEDLFTKVLVHGCLNCCKNTMAVHPFKSFIVLENASSLSWEVSVGKAVLEKAALNPLMFRDLWISYALFFPLLDVNAIL